MELKDSLISRTEGNLQMETGVVRAGVHVPLPPLAAANREQKVTRQFQVWIGDGAASLCWWGQLGEPWSLCQQGLGKACPWWRQHFGMGTTAL